MPAQSKTGLSRNKGMRNVRVLAVLAIGALLSNLAAVWAQAPEPSWVQLPGLTLSPEARYDFAVAYDAVRGQVLRFGGA
jgi:hypothetical protein